MRKLTLRETVAFFLFKTFYNFIFILSQTSLTTVFILFETLLIIGNLKKTKINILY